MIAPLSVNNILDKAVAGERISPEEGLRLMQSGDLAALGRAAAIGSHQAENVIGEVAMGGPQFRAIDPINVSVPGRRGAQARKVGAATRFGIALAPVMLAGQNLWQVVGLLLRGAIAKEHRREHAKA